MYISDASQDKLLCSECLLLARVEPPYLILRALMAGLVYSSSGIVFNRRFLCVLFYFKKRIFLIQKEIELQRICVFPFQRKNRSAQTVGGEVFQTPKI